MEKNEKLRYCDQICCCRFSVWTLMSKIRSIILNTVRKATFLKSYSLQPSESGKLSSTVSSLKSFVV